MLTFYWHISKIKYFGRINSAKGKYPTLFLFIFLSHLKKESIDGCIEMLC